jgi:hypothetical protein
MAEQKVPSSPAADGNGQPSVDTTFDLGSITPLRKLAVIDGVSYELVDVNELGIGPRSRLDKLVQRCIALERKGEKILAKEEQEYDARLLTLSKQLLPDCPPGIIDKLSLGARSELVGRFLVETTLDSPRLQMLERLMRRTRSHDSSTPTEETPSAGSKSPRN